MALARRSAGATGAALAAWPRAHVAWLAIAGLTLVIVSFIAVALLTGSEVGRTYVPPRLEEGVIVPAETR